MQFIAMNKRVDDNLGAPGAKDEEAWRIFCSSNSVSTSLILGIDEMTTNNLLSFHITWQRKLVADKLC